MCAALLCLVLASRQVSCAAVSASPLVSKHFHRPAFLYGSCRITGNAAQLANVAPAGSEPEPQLDDEEEDKL